MTTVAAAAATTTTTAAAAAAAAADDSDATVGMDESGSDTDPMDAGPAPPLQAAVVATHAVTMHAAGGAAGAHSSKGPDKSGLFYRWQKLVKVIEQESSYTAKTGAIATFIKTFEYVCL